MCLLAQGHRIRRMRIFVLLTRAYSDEDRSHEKRLCLSTTLTSLQRLPMTRKLPNITTCRASGRAMLRRQRWSRHGLALQALGVVRVKAAGTLSPRQSDRGARWRRKCVRQRL
jgi:hypothetical protein